MPLKHSDGYSLLELLVVLAILSLVGWATIPSLQHYQQRAQLQQQLQAYTQAAQQARQYAMAHGQTVAMAAPQRNWQLGWQVFIDQDRDGAYTSGTDTLLQSYPALPAGLQVQAPTDHTGGTNTFALGYVLWTPQGFPRTATGGMATGHLLFSSASLSYQLILHRTGRLRSCIPTEC